jgi:hypothetical protein
MVALILPCAASSPLPSRDSPVTARRCCYDPRDPTSLHYRRPDHHLHHTADNRTVSTYMCGDKRLAQRLRAANNASRGRDLMSQLMSRDGGSGDGLARMDAHTTTPQHHHPHPPNTHFLEANDRQNPTSAHRGPEMRTTRNGVSTAEPFGRSMVPCIKQEPTLSS